MAHIKTKDTIKKSIKQIDKAVVIAERIKIATVSIKEKAERSMHTDGSSASEYAVNQTQNTANHTAHILSKQAQRGFEATKNNFTKSKEQNKQYRQKQSDKKLKQKYYSDKSFYEIIGK